MLRKGRNVHGFSVKVEISQNPAIPLLFVLHLRWYFLSWWLVGISFSILISQWTYNELRVNLGPPWPLNWHEPGPGRRSALSPGQEEPHPYSTGFKVTGITPTWLTCSLSLSYRDSLCYLCNISVSLQLFPNKTAVEVGMWCSNCHWGLLHPSLECLVQVPATRLLILASC